MNHKLPKLLMSALLSALAVTGTIFCVVTAFDLSCSVVVVMLTALAASAVFTWGFQNNRFLLSLIPLLLLAAALALTNSFTTLQSTWLQLLHDILTRFSSAYKNISFSIPEARAAGTVSYNLFFAMVAVLLSLWMSWGVGYRSCLISIAGTLPFLLLCVIINDTPPNVVPLILLVTVWITVLLTRGHENDAPLVDATRTLLVMLTVLLVFGIVGAVYPKEDTASQDLPQVVDDMISRMPETMQDLFEHDSVGPSRQQIGADTSDTLDLTKEGVRNRTDDVTMQLSSTESGVLYLRAAAKNIYTGTAWESDDSATASESAYAHTSLGTSFGSSQQAAVQIKNYRDNTDVGFLPYGYISCSSADDFTSDLRVSMLSDDYIIYYWPGVSTLDITEPAGEVNTDYDQHVKDTCLNLPEDTADTLYQLAIDAGYDPDMTEAETISWVASYIRSCGTYNVNVSCQPSNLDFAVYFLTESKQGYCVHFATAACAMYRALGIPSRYASGYRVTITEAESVTDVTDLDTHAWAEVYVSGLGWIPVETTPGFGETTSLPDPTVQDTEETEETPEESPEPEDSAEEEASDLESDAEPSTSPSPTPTAVPASESSSEEDGQQAQEAQVQEQEQEQSAGQEADPSPSPSSDPDEVIVEDGEVYVDSSGHSTVILWILGVVLVLLAGAAGIVIRHAILKNRLEHGLRSEDANAAVIAAWSYLEQLERYGITPDEKLEAIALKAKFSQHSITPEELQEFRGSANVLKTSCEDSLSFAKKLVYRWIRVLDLDIPEAS